jgi:hypothetical protein
VKASRGNSRHLRDNSWHLREITRDNFVIYLPTTLRDNSLQLCDITADNLVRCLVTASWDNSWQLRETTRNSFLRSVLTMPKVLSWWPCRDLFVGISAICVLTFMWFGVGSSLISLLADSWFLSEPFRWLCPCSLVPWPSPTWQVPEKDM